MSSPILWGPNSTSNSLQNRLLLANGTQISYNGSKNYISYGNFEDGLTTGWSLASTSLVSYVPVTTATPGVAYSASSGAPPSNRIHIATTTTNPLGGLSSLNLTCSSLPSIGDLLISQAYTIDLEDQSRFLNFSFYYQLISGSGFNFTGTNLNNFAIYIYDVTHGAWISPSGVYSMTQSSGIGLASGSFSVPAGLTQFQIALVQINSYSTSSFSLYFDDFFVGPTSVASLGPSVNAKLGLYTSITSTPGSTVVYDTVLFDTNSAYSTSTGKYTAPVAGVYSVDISAYANPTSTGSLILNTTSGSNTYLCSTVSSTQISGGASMVKLNAGDQLWVTIDNNGVQLYGSGSAVTFYNTISISLLTPTTQISPATQAAPTNQTFLSGSGTYTLPTNPTPLYIRVRMAGGGGGGGGSGTTGATNGATGGSTTFGLSTASGGLFGGNSSGNSGIGGTASLGAGFLGIALQGGGGGGTLGGGANESYEAGGTGGNSPLGGGGAGLVASSGAGAANTGGGGSGGGTFGTASQSGFGGGAGGYVDAIINAPLSSYSYSVGSGGSGGSAGTNGYNGGVGGSGIIIVDEYYPANTIATTPNGNAPTIQKFTSGSGTYTRPSNPAPLWIKVRMLGGGGGGGDVSASTAGGTGGTTTFGTSLLSAGGGTGGGYNGSYSGGAGGTASISSPALNLASVNGSGGMGGGFASSAGAASGPLGGVGAMGGSGYSQLNPSVAPAANSGSGGMGSSAPSSNATGGGGGAGAYVEAIIQSPSASYSYSVGAAGTGSGSNATAGAAGVIIVEEYYAASSTITSVVTSSGNANLTTVTTASATLTSTNNYVIVNYGAGTCNISIPGAATSGQVFNIKTITNQPVIVTPTSGTIDGASSLTISGQYTSADIVSDGTNYWIV